ncbi:Na+/H+ antiporter subunit E [Halothiobacillus sp. DCM-1]|uniref:Na+/H+ antiporter subunit E n=1 Tax=Halothiobacillus sp. DCM-1 TaxID=3112558 RepID=UPI00325104B7
MGFFHRLRERSGWWLMLWLTWLVLSNSLAPGQLLLGGLISALITGWMPRFEQPPLRIRHFPRLLAYGGLLLWDILRANLTVARQVLGPVAALQPAFLDIPLSAQHPLVISLFASTITLTPGTVSCELSADGRSLRVHALHSPDPAADIHTLKTRYEDRLRAIFEPVAGETA